MENEKGSGFITLAKKTLTVITASLSALMIDQNSAISATPKTAEVSKSMMYESLQNINLKPQFVLKLNQSNPLAMDASHGSHRSHSSHSSHSSHYSSSSSSSYTAPVTTPKTKVDTITPTYKPPVSSNSSSTKLGVANTESKLTYHMLGTRDLKQGDEGTDVQQLQLGLIKLNYEILSNGLFGATTELAVMKFQVANNLKINGVVDSLTLKKIQSQLK
jgi:His-Xaa-Ser repeat protein HxsA